MFSIKTPVPRVPGLRGSDLARAENLDYAGPYKPLGRQPLYGSGSSDGGASGVGGYKGTCGGSVTTGNSGGSGGNNPDNDMNYPAYNGCYQPSGPINRPPGPCPPCPSGPPPGGGGGGGGGGGAPGGPGPGPGCRKGGC
jgi:hypothetical protein